MLKKEDIIGRTIREIRCHGETKDDLDFADVCFILDNNVCFSLPMTFPEYEFEPGMPPPQAKSLRLKSVVGRRIAAMTYAERDGEPVPDPVGLLLEDGSLVTVEVVAPHGLGAAGIYVSKKELVNNSVLRDYWELRKEAEP